MADIPPINTFESHGTTMSDIPQATMMFDTTQPGMNMCGIPQTAMFEADTPQTDTTDDSEDTSSDESVAGNLQWVQGPQGPLFFCSEVEFESGNPYAPASKVNMAKLITASTYFRRLLQEDTTNPENGGAIIVKVSFNDVQPEVLRRMIHWVETGQLLETYTVQQYSTVPTEADASPWMMLVLLYQAGVKFEMPKLMNAVVCKIVDMVLITRTVPCGTLKAVYSGTTPGDPLRRLMVDIVASMGTSRQYWQHCLEWNSEIYWDLLIAVKEVPGRTPEFATRLKDYLSVI